MYPKFIEVHSQTGTPATLNIDHIVGFCADHNGSVITTCGVRVEQVLCSETYDEVKQMITDSGCLIRKQDPRLDTEHPLTMDDLQSMVGEPVWNSNIDEWGLVTKDPEWHEEIQEGYFLRYQDGTMTLLEEEWLKKYPHYRMRK